MAKIKVFLFLLIIFMTALGAFAGLFLKKASSNLEFMKLIRNLNLYLGGMLYLMAALVNIYVLKYLDYSIVLPLTSITYIWTMLIAHFILHEKINRRKILGVGCILLGTIIIAI
ncbi:MAG: EamA family transporter [Bacillota bacterium]|nr:EamA family transporter [Bacillota bacterium]